MLKFVMSALLLASSSLSWAAGSADQTVREVSDSLLSRLAAEQKEIKAKPQRVESIVRELVLPHFDAEALSRRVLAKNWKAASEAQQQKFTSEFSAYLVRFYSKAFANYNGETVDYDPKVEINDRGVALVKTRIMRKSGAPIPVSYQMAPDNGGWKIVDVVIEGISLVQSKRDEFAPFVSNNGLDALIADLASKNKQLGSAL